VVERITASNGKVLYTHNGQPLGRIIEARYVAMMNEMMAQTLLIGTARKATLPGWPAAGKTGTSQDFRDAWFIGYTAHLVTGVWLGNDDGTPTKKVTGGGLPVEIWSRFMRGAHQGIPVAALPGPPAGGTIAGLFNGYTRAPTPATNGMAPAPPAPIQSAGNTPSARGASLDGWLLDNLFGRSRN
jgi:penicillin-binding protein 1A